MWQSGQESARTAAVLKEIQAARLTQARGGGAGVRPSPALRRRRAASAGRANLRTAITRTYFMAQCMVRRYLAIVQEWRALMRNPLARCDAVRGMSAQDRFFARKSAGSMTLPHSPRRSSARRSRWVGGSGAPHGRGRRRACHLSGPACANWTGARREMPCLPSDRLAAAEDGPGLATLARGWCLNEAGQRDVA
jgi:hypothetical protein